MDRFEKGFEKGFEEGWTQAIERILKLECGSVDELKEMIEELKP